MRTGHCLAGRGARWIRVASLAGCFLRPWLSRFFLVFVGARLERRRCGVEQGGRGSADLSAGDWELSPACAAIFFGTPRAFGAARARPGACRIPGFAASIPSARPTHKPSRTRSVRGYAHRFSPQCGSLCERRVRISCATCLIPGCSAPRNSPSLGRLILSTQRAEWSMNHFAADAQLDAQDAARVLGSPTLRPARRSGLKKKWASDAASASLGPNQPWAPSSRRPWRRRRRRRGEDGASALRRAATGGRCAAPSPASSIGLERCADPGTNPERD